MSSMNVIRGRVLCKWEGHEFLDGIRYWITFCVDLRLSHLHRGDLLSFDWSCNLFFTYQAIVSLTGADGTGHLSFLAFPDLPVSTYTAFWLVRAVLGRKMIPVDSDALALDSGVYSG